MGYYDDIQRIRQARAQQDVAERVEQIKADLAETTQYRDAAAGQYHGAADQETRDENCANWHALDRECAQLEAELAQFVPRQPQLSQKATAYLRQRESFNRRYGDRATQAYGAAHQHALSAGLQPDTDDYYKFVDDTLEINGPAYNGVRFDPNEKTLSPNEACKISGVTPELYNRMRAKMLNQGKNSDTLYGQQWKKSVG